MRDRIFIDDGYDIAIAVKRGKNTMMENFQEYWKNRCGNPGYLNDGEVFEVLANFAVENFDREDWYKLFKGYLPSWFWSNHIKNHENKGFTDSIPRSMINELILTVIWLMKMRYED